MADRLDARFLHLSETNVMIEEQIQQQMALQQQLEQHNRQTENELTRLRQ